MATSRSSGYHHGDLRNALERAGLELIAEKGAQGLTMAEASRRAGVSVAAPFKHFASKAALLAALALRGYQEQATRFAAAVASTSDPVEQLGEFAAAYVQFVADDRALFDITFAAGIDKHVHPELERAGQEVLDVLTEPAGQLRPDPRTALALVHGVAAVAHGYAVFLGEGVFGDQAKALEQAKSEARDSAQVLAASGPRRA